MTSFVSLRRKITLALFAALGGSLGVVFLALGLIEYRAAEVRARASLEALGNTLAAGLAPALALDAPETVAEPIRQLAPTSQIIGMTVYRWPAGTAEAPFIQYLRPGSTLKFSPAPHPPGFTRQGNRALLVRQVEAGAVPVGLVLLETDLGSFRRGYHETILLFGGALVLSALAMFAISRVLQRILTRPLLKLAETAAQIHRTGDFTLRAAVSSGDEIGRLADSINEMLASIASRDQQLAEQAAFQHTVLENAGTIVISGDLGGTIRTFNAAAERLLQYRRDEVVGLANATLFHAPEEIAQQAARLSQESGRTIPPDFHVFAELARRPANAMQWTYVRKDGSRFPVFLIVSTLRTADGRQIGYCGIAADLTERQAAEEAVRASEERLRLALESSPLGVSLIRRDGTILFLNRKFTEWFGFTSADIPTVSDWWPRAYPDPLYRAEIQRLWNSRMADAEARSGEMQPSEARVTGKDGHQRIIEFHGQHFDDMVLVTFSDITERRNREEALARSESRFRSVAERTGQLIFDWDLATGRVEWTGAATPIIGYSCDFLAAHGPEWWREQIHPEDLAHATTVWGQIHQLGRIDQFTYRFRRADGSWCHLMTNAVALEGPDGHQQRILAAIADVTRQQEAAEAVRQLNAELEQKVRERTVELDRRIAEVEQLNAEQRQLMADLQSSQDDLAQIAGRLQEANANLLAANQELESFSYSVSHDLRAPLRNIAGFIELLRKRTAGQLDKEADHYLGIVGSEAVRMGALIDDLLTFSRIGRAELHLAPVQLGTLVAEVQTELHSDLTGRQIDWRLQPLPAVLGDRTLLRQVVANLLANAVKFTRKRTPAIIEIGVQPAPPGTELLTFFVRDNGAGFDPKYTAKLFGVFQRLHNIRDYEGTGIGLANVKRIVNRHGGHVWAEGAVDHGATFFFSLKPAAS